VRVLIVRIGAMGDVLHAMPAVAALRVAHPDWFIGWAIEPRWSDLLQIAGDPNDLSQISGRSDAKALVSRWYRAAATRWKRSPLARETQMDIFSLRKTLQAEEFDLCVDMQGSLKSAVVGKMASAKVFAGPAEPREKFARRLYDKHLNATADHVVEQGCELLSAAVGKQLQPAPVALPLDERAERWADEQVGQEKFCLISPGGGWGAKLWPAERFGQVAAALRQDGLPTIVNTSPDGSPEAGAVVAASSGAARALPCSVSQLIALTRRAVLVIGGDTGPLHLGAALQRPVVAIFGPTNPRRNGPYGTLAKVLRDPSSITSHKRIKEPEEGMLKIEVEEVVAAARELLTESQPT
jgi:heptosyltransferase-1